MHQALYTSTPCPGFAEEWTDLVIKARQANAAKQITGILMFDGDAITQVLEGGSEDVLSLVRRIMADRRHSKIDVKRIRTVVDRQMRNAALVALNSAAGAIPLIKLVRLQMQYIDDPVICETVLAAALRCASRGLSVQASIAAY